MSPPGGADAPFRHAIADCFAAAIGPAGLDNGDYQAVLAETEAGLGALRAAHENASLPLLRLAAQRDDIAALRPIAAHCRETLDDVVVLGTGGSSLGGRSLVALADVGFGPAAGAPRIHFMDNVDPHSFTALFAAIDPGRCGLIVISKSGSTAETMTQFLTCLDAGLSDNRVIVITEPRDNALRRLAESRGMTVFDHDPGIGGRFSVLSPVGLLPAMIAGLDVVALRGGAAWSLDQALGATSPGECEAAIGAAINVALCRRRGITSTVLMPYVDRLADFGLWFRQLWAESLGKNGEGTTPIRALGTVDQHSQLQLYLDGPNDKLHTLVVVDAPVAGTPLHPPLDLVPELDYLDGHNMGQLLVAEQRATAAALARNGRPVRVLHLPRLDERAMGALMMHFMLETIIAANLFGVDAFDQPAVEEGKRLAREYLAAGPGAPEPA